MKKAPGGIHQGCLPGRPLIDISGAFVSGVGLLYHIKLLNGACSAGRFP